MEDLKGMLAKVKVGDYVTVFGKATTGAEVTRTGVLLVEPEDMRATHDGKKVPAIRVRVGKEGTDPAKRSTWTTLIPGHGSIRPAGHPQEESEGQEPSGLDWQAIMVASLTNQAPFLYGGKGTKGTVPQQPRKVTAGSRGFNGLNLLSDSGEVVVSLKNSNKVWVAEIPEGWKPELGDDEHQDVTGLDHGKPVYHVTTGKLVGYWTPEKFTPIEETRD
ncbi:hypothetical protein [Streptomyces sp. NPDC056290]